MPLFPYQQEALDKLKSKRARLIGDDMGLGKTYEGIAIDQANRAGDGNEKVPASALRNAKTLIICPKSVISVWDEHCMDLTDEDVYVIDAKNRHIFVRAALDPKAHGYFIIHWDALRLEPDLAKVTWFHIMADEVHRAKNRKAQSTRALKKLPTWYKTGLSGTPADNKPQDIWSILNWLWPGYYTSYWTFVKDYMVAMPVLDKNGEDTGYSTYEVVEDALPHLRRQMEPWFIRRLKTEVLTDLPDKYYKRVWVDLSPKQRKAYDTMKKVAVVWAEDHADEIAAGDPIIANAVVAQLIRLQQYADGYLIPRLDAQGEQAYKFVHKGHKRNQPCTEKCGDKPIYDMTDPSAKLDTLMDLLEDREGEQVVVFSQFKSAINLLATRLEAKKIPYGLLTGDIGQADRALNIQEFQSGRSRVFAGTIAAGGVGITLTAASTVIFIDRAWSPAYNLQAEDRLHRIGQENAVEVIDLMAKNTVDLGKAQQLSKKWEWIQKLLGDKITQQEAIQELDLTAVLDIELEEED
jgi:SNF2 family DNA or RNA helicase